MRARRIDTPPIRTEASRARSTVITPPSGSERDISERTLIYFGCSKQPFAENHDPDQLFLGSLHQEAIAALIDAVECNSGLSAFIAESGMGKTMLLHCLLECYSTAAHTAFLPRSCGGASGLKQALLQELERLLQRDGGSDRRVLIVLDEAHNLTSSELEVVRALSDVENHTSKLLHFMMAGRPALADMLLQPPLIDLKPRITVVNRDLRLTPGETERYINRRLSLSGYSGPPLFDREVIGEIAALTRGVPRQVNTICTKAMSRACGLEQKEITGSIIRDVTAVGPSFQVLPLPIKQIDRLDVDPLTHEEQRPARSFVIASSRTQPQSVLQRIRLPQIFHGSYHEVVAAGMGAIAVTLICFGVLYALTFGPTSHRSAEPAVSTQIDNRRPEHPAVAALDASKSGSELSNSSTETTTNYVARSPLQSNDTSPSSNEEQTASPTTVASAEEETAVNRPADQQTARPASNTDSPDSEIPPQLAVPATSALQMPALHAPVASARVPMSTPSPSTPGLLSTSEATSALDASSPEVVKMVRPTYPSKAKKQKIYGEVVVTGVVGADGKLKMITTSGPDLLEEAALKAAQEWRYKPPVLNGDPVEATARIVFNFSQPD